jgi:1-acylglycerone phosphate reductase
MKARRTVVITGCSDGSLGAALAQAFHLANWRVFATARNLNKLTECRATGIETLALDVTSESSISACAKEVAALTNGSLDALINNAGAGYSMPVLDVDADEFARLFALNCISIAITAKAFFPLLLQAANSSQFVPIVANHTSISSVAGLPLPFVGPYSATKAAAAMLSDTLRLELAPFGIYVVDIKTGVVRSKFYENQNSNTTKTTLPDDSIYNISRDVVERAIHGSRPSSDFEDAAIWAKNVVHDLEKSRRPPLQIWRGTLARTVRLASSMPVGWLDTMMKKRTGLDVIEQKWKESKQAK